MDIRGTESADVLNGGAGDDVIYGFGGNDTLKGGAGDDVLAGNDGNDILQGGDGDDYIQGGAGNDTIDGGAGNDWAGYDDATAGVKVDLNITGAQNTDGSGTDKLTGIENLHGSAFNDTLIGDAKDNVIIGDSGADTISGGKGDDTLWGSAGADALDGGDGDDWLVGGAGDDVIKGGAGGDWASYEDATAGVKVDLTKTAAQDTVGAGKDTLTGVENLWGSAFDDTLTGDAGSNYLFGAAGNDTLSGGAGDDYLSGGAGVNVLDGGAGNDTIDYAMSDVGVEVDLSRNTATSRTDATIKDTLSSIELVTGSTHDDTIVGNMAENYLFGDAGNDVLIAVGGHDTLDGGDGNDILRGSFYKPGDMLLGGAGDDQIIVWAGPGSEGDATIVDGGSGIDDLIFSTAADITLNLANAGDQVISPGVHMIVSNIENVMGSSGNDRLIGDTGNNVINGGQGDDILDGGAGFDIASYASTGPVRVDLSKTGPQDTGGAGVDTLSNFEGLKGSSAGDILIGDAKDNTLQGSSGNDILDGGAGVDTAIYVGATTDYTWTLNANGIWTVKGLEGVDTLLNVETLKFNDKSVTLSPSATTVTVDDLVGLAKPKTLVTSAKGGILDVVSSSDGRTVYVSDKDGYVSGYGAQTGEIVGRWKVGTSLTGMDVSGDGRYLVASESQAEDLYSQTPQIKVHVLDLQTGSVKDYVASNFGDSGFSDAGFTADGKVVLTQSIIGGSGLQPLTVLDLATGAFTRAVQSFGQDAAISVSDDHKTFLMAPANISDARLAIFTQQNGVTATHQNYADGVEGYNNGIQALSGDGAHVAQWLYVYDKDLKFVTDLEKAHPEILDVYGEDFSSDGQHLFIVDSLLDKIFQFSTSTWELEQVFSIGVNVAWGDVVHRHNPSIYGDNVIVGGERMIISSPTSVIAVNLLGLVADGGTDHADTLAGGAGADLLQGYGGNDVLSAGGGDDTLVGGKGSDTLTGGSGNDTFSVSMEDSLPSDTTTGAGVDVVTDFEAGDKLVFTSQFSLGSIYGEGSANSYAAALALANEKMIPHENMGGTKVISSIQVGADVYVFAGETSTVGGGHLSNVVKLVGVGLDAVDTNNVFAKATWL